MNPNVTTGPPPQAGRREWIGLAVLALPTLLLSIDFSVLYLALSHLSADLKPTSTQQLWIADIHGFMIAGFLITIGTLGDRIGRRRMLLMGAAAFGVASVLAAFSTSPQMLIGARALLGIGAATLMPSILALISTMFRDPRQRAVAIAMWMSCFMAGSAIGPLIGGAMLEVFWWGSVFLLGVPVMVLLLLVGPALLPEHRNADAGRLDLTSVALSLATILPIVYGITELARVGLEPLPVLTLVIGAVVGVVFVSRQRRLPNPLLDLRLFGIRSFTGALVVLMLGPAVMGGVGLFVNQYLQMVGGLSPLTTAVTLLPSTTAAIAGALLAPAVAQRIRPGFVIAAACVSLALGGLLLTRVDSSGVVVVLVSAYVLIGLGFGVIAALGTGLVVGAAPPDRAGGAAAMSETSSQLGVAMGVAVLGSIGTAVYRAQMAGAVPAGVPADAAAASRDSLPGALGAAQQLPEQLVGALIGPAREAFTNGLNLAGAVTAAAMLVVAALVAVLLRHVRPTARAEQPGPAEPVPGGEAARVGDAVGARARLS